MYLIYEKDLQNLKEKGKRYANGTELSNAIIANTLYL